MHPKPHKSIHSNADGPGGRKLDRNNLIIDKVMVKYVVIYSHKYDTTLKVNGHV